MPRCSNEEVNRPSVGLQVVSSSSSPLPSFIAAVMTSELRFSTEDGGKTFTRRLFGLEAFLGTIAHVFVSLCSSTVILTPIAFV